MIDALFDLAAKGFLSQGLLGAANIILMVVIWYLWAEIKIERGRCAEAQKEIIKLGADNVRVNSDMARSIEERNRQTGEMVQTNIKLGLAIQHLGEILEMQHSRVVDLLNGLKNKVL